MKVGGKTAVVFAATGAIGSAVSRRLAADGARIFISGRRGDEIERLARDIGAGWAVVDATDETQVEGWLDDLAKQANGLDIVFNAIGPRAAAAGYATPSTRLPVDTFLLPLTLIVGSQFLTARVAARRMAAQGRGAIVTLSASLSGGFVPFMAGITAACGAVEAMTRSLAAEFGPDGVRLNCVRAGGMPETRTIGETLALMARERGTTPGAAGARTMSTVLGRPVRLDETAAAVAWLASDAASGVAGQVVNVCAGALVS
jgi:3-oxoacyl-[acyl-carrier protein] reductase